MKLLDEEQQRWYCYKDNELFWARDNIWGPKPTVRQQAPRQEKTGTFKQGIMRGVGISMVLGSIGGALNVLSSLSNLSYIESVIDYCKSLQACPYSETIPISFSQSANEDFVGFWVSVVIAIIALLVMEITRKNEYSYGLWLGFGAANIVGGVGYLWQGVQFRSLGTLNLSVGEIVSAARAGLIETAGITIGVFAVALVLIHLGAKRTVIAAAPKAPEAPQPEVPPTIKVEAPMMIPSMKFCRFCGAKILRDSIYCEECGTRLLEVS
jgi:hypothetical protein